MRQYDPFNAITRRALRINYLSPFICEFQVQSSGSSSGSGGSVTAVIGVLPVTRAAGPASISLEGAILTWGSQPYIYSYTIYVSTHPEGPFTLFTSNVLTTSFDVSGIGPGEFFIKVTGVEPTAGETLPSPLLGPVSVV